MLEEMPVVLFFSLTICGLPYVTRSTPMSALEAKSRRQNR
jgi:hypothetical protein